MNITEAAAYQASFDAVANGAATDAQCVEVADIGEQLRAYLQDVTLKAKALPERKEAFLSLVAPEVRAKIEAAIAVDKV